MNKLCVLLACIGLLVSTGCTNLGGDQTAAQCRKNAETYELYIQALADGKILNEEQIAQARLAAVFLNVYCNWQTPAEDGLTKDPVADKNGVLIVSP